MSSPHRAQGPLHAQHMIIAAGIKGLLAGGAFEDLGERKLYNGFVQVKLTY